MGQLRTGNKRRNRAAIALQARTKAAETAPPAIVGTDKAAS